MANDEGASWSTISSQGTLYVKLDTQNKLYALSDFQALTLTHIMLILCHISFVLFFIFRLLCEGC